MSFQSEFNTYLNTIDTYLHKSLDLKKGSKYDAMRYSLYAGGKRIRPMITLACCDALGGDFEAALCYGCAIEMIHTYSLIHDDLPCMDNDALRRGKPTNHIVFGEDMAVLAGAALLNYACESVVNSGIDNPSMHLKALKIIYTASGAEGMIGGQVMDMAAEKEPVSGDTLSLLHKKKTGALISAAASLGAISAQREQDIFSEYAQALGLAFQIRDDILDIEGDTLTFGKPIRSDEKNNKTTYVTLYGIDGAKKKLKEETDRAIQSLDFLKDNGAFLRNLALYLLERKN